MKEKITEIAIWLAISMVLIILVYGLFVFNELEPNPFKWEKVTRVGFSFFGVVLPCVFAFIIKYEFRL